MKFKFAHTHLLILTIILISAAYLSGLPSVPFHPDESTHIFMSADFDLLFSHPSDLFWQPGSSSDLRQHYRLLDAPLTRYMVGVGRLLAGGLEPLSSDWDWTETWQHNLTIGAYPEKDLLLAARLPLALLFPLTLLLLFITVEKIASKPAAWIALILLASNALVLLHTRRAMAEPALLFTIVLTLFTLVKADRSPWWAAVPAALAFCAKQSAGVMIVPVGIAILWQKIPVHQRLLQLVLAGGLFTGIIFTLNPFLWDHPIAASQEALAKRSELTTNQISALRAANPEKVLDSFPMRMAAQIGQLFFIKPAIWDIGNYIIEQHDEEQAYLANPLHRFLRSPIGGLFVMMLSLFGFIVSGLYAFRQKARALTLILMANLLQLAVLLLFVPLPIQRYTLPLVPFVCIWSGIGIWKVVEMAQTLTSRTGIRARS
jgi:4-amino-4-deoxy-L-arabinose transferase-like glycosyltransferase